MDRKDGAMTASDFLNMGAYGFYVWGAYAFCALLIAIESFAVRARFRSSERTGRATSSAGER
jgi:heme exporter protein CcmD